MHIKEVSNDDALLDLMMKDSAETVIGWQPGSYWRSYADRVCYWIKKDGLSSFRRHEGIGKGFADTYAHTPDRLMAPAALTRKLRKFYGLVIPYFRKKICQPYDDLINSHISRIVELEQTIYQLRDADLLERAAKTLSSIDTLKGDTQSIVHQGDQKLSVSYIEGLRRLDQFEGHIDFPSIKTFVEIGGGFGSQTHLILHKYPNIKTVFYVDIPPILYVGTQYLKAHFGGRVMDYAEAKTSYERGNFSPEGRIVAVPPWFLDNIKCGVDLVWNACSFQEMDEVNLSGYMKWVAKNKSGEKVQMAMVWYPHDTGSTSLTTFKKILSQNAIETHELNNDILGYRYFIS